MMGGSRGEITICRERGAYGVEADLVDRLYGAAASSTSLLRQQL
jgi:hypothetical protein